MVVGRGKMKKVFSSMTLIFVLFMFGCGNRRNSAEVMRTSSFVQWQPIESNEPQGSIKSVAITEADLDIPADTIPEDTTENVATAILNMTDFQFHQSIVQNFDLCVTDIERIFVLSAEADCLLNCLKEICRNPLAPLFDEQDNYESVIEVVHDLALVKIGSVSKSVNNFYSNLLEAKEVARDTVVSSWNAVRSHDEQVQDIAKIQRDVHAALQDLEDVKTYVNSGNLEYQRAQDVLNEINIIFNSANKGNRAQNILMFDRFFKSRNYRQRIDINAISNDLNDAFIRADINNVINQLGAISSNLNLKDFVNRVNQLAHLLNN
jgi:hypothetical protein